MAIPTAETAERIKTMVEDAVDDGVRVAKRAVKSMQRGIDTLEDVKDDGIRYVRRQPIKSVALAAGAGLLIGVAVVWIGSRLRERC
jgi:ElaB/YqjD/DUF883 family membrane-anchored ribosome-binding protein